MNKKVYSVLIELPAETFLAIKREADQRQVKFAQVIVEAIEIKNSKQEACGRDWGHLPSHDLPGGQDDRAFFAALKKAQEPKP